MMKCQSIDCLVPVFILRENPALEQVVLTCLQWSDEGINKTAVDRTAEEETQDQIDTFCVQANPLNAANKVFLPLLSMFMFWPEDLRSNSDITALALTLNH